MKKLLLSLIIILAISQIIFTQQRYAGSIFDIHEDSQIDKIPRGLSKIENALTPESFINFDDWIFSADNSVQINPNRYSGVSFYAPYSNTPTWLTHLVNYSYPNALFVGICCDPNGRINSVDSLVIDFAQNSKDISFRWGTSGWYNTGIIEVYEGVNYQLVASSQVNLNYYWNFFTVNPSQKIRRIILRRPNGNYPAGNGHIDIDDFQFSPGSNTSSPVGYLDSVNTSNPVGAVGWSVDPDNTSASNTVHCYVDGPAGSGSRFLGSVPANLPGTGIPYPGNHRFLMPIPADLRNNLTHQMYCYGIDISGGDANTLLTGSPKSFRFSTETIGWIEVVGSLTESNNAVAISEGEIVGWSLDTDLPGNSNTVHFWVDGQANTPGAVFMGTAFANIPRPDVNTTTGYQGDHGYSFSIPDQFRDGITHTIYAYGIDLTGGPNKLLQGSPKPFKLDTKVSTLTFEPISNLRISSVIDINPNSGGGQRIFPDKDDPNVSIDPYSHATVQVKAFVTPAKQGVKVYFKKYDLDDPSANMLPLDDDTGTNTGNDNRGNRGTLQQSGTLSAVSALTDASGIATVNFTTTMQPGDNFAVAASTNNTYLGTVTIDGTNLKDNANTQIPTTLACSSSAVNACRTDMLTVWRRLHIEVDSMAAATGNNVQGNFPSAVTISSGANTLTVNTATPLEVNRFENGRLAFTDSSGNVKSFNVIGYDSNTTPPTDANTATTVTINTFRPYTVKAGQSFTLYDDDDFNDDSPPNRLDGDEGELIVERTETFAAMRANDDLICADQDCNIYGAAYIKPEYAWARIKGFNQTNVPFQLNVNVSGSGQLDTYVMPHRNSTSSSEKKDFWVVYVLLSYQGLQLEDFDGRDMAGLLEDGTGGETSGVGTFFDDLPTSGLLPTGSNATLFYLESARDLEIAASSHPEWNAGTVPHEIGHQMGLDGDKINFGIMSSTGATFNFVDRHTNILRSRIESPGQ
jgi:hypothetical protein